jgi:hypothetical protein
MKKKIYYFTTLFIIFILFLSSCKKSDDKLLKIATPTGAPMLAQLDISYDVYKEKEKRFETSILSGPDEIKASFLEGRYDLIYAPINIGAQIYNANQSYRLLAGITFGNLYFVSKDKIDDIHDLDNKDIILFGKNTINDLIATYIINSNDIKPKTISYVSDVQAIKANLIESNNNEVYLIADPIKSVVESSINISVLSIQDLFNDLKNISGFAQAGLFVKYSSYTSNTDLINDYINLLKESINSLNKEENIIETNNKIKELKYFNFSDKVMLDAIIGSNIRFVEGKNMKNIVENTYNLNLKLLGGKLPDEDFYKL